MVPTSYYLALSGILFSLGLIGVMTRRTAILIILSVELVAFARSWGDLMGQTAVFIVMTLAAAEVAIGLAIIVAIFRKRETTNVDDLAQLKG